MLYIYDDQEACHQIARVNPRVRITQEKGEKHREIRI